MTQRELTGHIVDPKSDLIQILVADEPGQGNACHKYKVVLPNGDVTEINFQNGPIKEFKVNGLTQEVLLEICIDRLNGFQSGPFACEANELALAYIKAAQKQLQSRTRERMQRGVEGTNTI